MATINTREKSSSRIEPLRSVRKPVERKICKFVKSKQLWQRANKFIAGGTTGTRKQLYPEFPTFFTRAKGCRMWDADGNEFIDLLCSIGPIILGYAYDRVDNAAAEVMRTSFQSSTSHPAMIDLAELLVEMVPCAEKVHFLKTGSAATSASARLARHITGRMHIARCGFHGWHDMWRMGMDGGTNPDAWKCVPEFDGTAEGLKQLFDKTKEKFAAVILCPADTKPFTPKNYRAIVDIAHEHGALVIFDEIKTGFRVAPGGAQELLGVTPDLTTLSKGLANGYPLSVVVGKAEYMDEFPETPTGGTFNVEALSIAAATATVKEIKEKNVTAHLWKVGSRLIDGLNRICRDYRMEKATAFADPVPSMPRFTWTPEVNNGMSDPIHQYFFGECFKYGLFFCPWHVGFVNFSHTEKDIDEILDICDYVMAKTKRNLGNLDTKAFI